MSFLAKFGQVLLKVTQLATGFGPLISPFLPPKAAAVEQDLLVKIGAVVGTTESIVAAIGNPALTGADKLRGAVPLVAQIIQTSELVAGKKIKDEAKFTKAVQDITSAVADLLNSLEG